VASTPAPAPFVAPAYADVAQKDLFARDRNPNVVVEPVVVKPRPPWPPMPVLYGVMGLPGGMIAMLAEKPDARSRGVKVGETIGNLKLVALSAEKLAFEFDGDVKEKSIDELMDRGGHEQAAQAAAAPVNPANAANAAPQRNATPPPPKPGVEIGAAGASVKACQQGGEPAPPGTVVDGYKLVKEATPFGEACRWIKQ
jgi:hypothetical protein